MDRGYFFWKLKTEMQPDLRVKLGGATETRCEEAKVVPICIYFFLCLSISFHMLAFAKLHAIGLS